MAASFEKGGGGTENGCGDGEIFDRLMRLKQIGLLREVLDSAHNGVLIIDRFGRILVFNRAAARYLGIDHSTLSRKARRNGHTVAE